jgi:hypothetical protein
MRTWCDRRVPLAARLVIHRRPWDMVWLTITRGWHIRGRGARLKNAFEASFGLTTRIARMMARWACLKHCCASGRIVLHKIRALDQRRMWHTRGTRLRVDLRLTVGCSFRRWLNAPVGAYRSVEAPFPASFGPSPLCARFGVSGRAGVGIAQRILVKCGMRADWWWWRLAGELRVHLEGVRR